jgi:3-oxoacyl-[acyl-carrier-protein] synthase I
MSQLLLAITGVGMVTGVGLNALAACAAIRAAIDNFEDTGFVDSGGEWIKGCAVSLPVPVRGTARLRKMAACAIEECLAGADEFSPLDTPLIFCGPEKQRPGQLLGDETLFLRSLQDELGIRFHSASTVIAQGHASIVLALRLARELLGKAGIRRVLVAAADSMLAASTLAYFEENDRLLTGRNSNGFIAGEAGAAILVEPVRRGDRGQLVCLGLGTGMEAATIQSEQALRGDGLCEAIRNALDEAGCGMGDLDFRICDLSGEQYHFKEASLALLRLLRQRKVEFDIWHPADCIGEVGAAIGLVLIGVLKAACEKGYSRGNCMLAHLGNDDGKRAALILSWRQTGG